MSLLRLLIEQVTPNSIFEYSQGAINNLIKKYKKEEPNLSDDNIKAYIERFDQIKQNFDKDKRDIFQYSWDDLESTVDEYKSNRDKQKSYGKLKDSKNKDEVYEENGIRIFKGDSKDKCIRFGTGYSFCISARGNRNMYNMYRKKYGGGTPYFILNENLSKDNRYHMLVVYVFAGTYEYLLTYADNRGERSFYSFNSLKREIEKGYGTKINFTEDLFEKIPLSGVELYQNIKDKGDHYEILGDVMIVNNKLNNLPKLDKPLIVFGDFICSSNKLTSLEGAPQDVGGTFDCSGNKLTSLEGAPEQVGENFICYSNKLTSLEGAPKKIDGNFSCSDNEITSLEGVPKVIWGDFACYRSNLTSLRGAPLTVEGDFLVNDNKLTSLEGSPRQIKGNFHCYNNKIKSLKGSPKEIEGEFNVYGNQITSLVGAPKEIGGAFNFYDNKVSSLRGAPKKVGDSVICALNAKQFSKEEVREYIEVGGKIII